MDDRSDTPFETNWFADAGREARNLAANARAGAPLDSRASGWPEPFDSGVGPRAAPTRGGPGYVPAYARGLERFRTLAFSDDRLAMVRSVYY